MCSSFHEPSIPLTAKPEKIKETTHQPSLINADKPNILLHSEKLDPTTHGKQSGSPVLVWEAWRPPPRPHRKQGAGQGAEPTLLR